MAVSDVSVKVAEAISKDWGNYLVEPEVRGKSSGINALKDSVARCSEVKKLRKTVVGIAKELHGGPEGPLVTKVEAVQNCGVKVLKAQGTLIRYSVPSDGQNSVSERSVGWIFIPKLGSNRVVFTVPVKIAEVIASDDVAKEVFLQTLNSQQADNYLVPTSAHYEYAITSVFRALAKVVGTKQSFEQFDRKRRAHSEDGALNALKGMVLFALDLP